MKPPRLSGPALVAARLAAETRGPRAAIREIMRRGLGMEVLETLPYDARGELPLDAKPLAANRSRSLDDARLPPPRGRDWPRTGASLVRAYREGAQSPRVVVERALAELERLPSRSPSMNVLTGSDRARSLREADAAAARYKANAPLGPLDGVPFLVKDEFDVTGLSTRLGSPCEPDVAAKSDATPVARLAKAGAVFVGKTVLTEWGMSPIGGNIHYAMPHNAHDPTRAPGGSSTGSAVGVALGIAPLAIGGDGGGSIRIPSSLNGVFGIKPTFGRCSRAGDGFKGSVAHAGPLGASTADLVAFLDATCSEHDPLDALTSWAPPPPAGGFGARVGAGVRGLRIGVDEGEWAEASPAVASIGKEALAALERDGAKLVPIQMPLGRHAAKIGFLTIGPESLAAHRREWLEQRAMLADDLRLAFAVLATFSALEQLDAQRLRTGLRLELQRTLGEVDVLALPTTAITAPRYNEQDARGAFSDPAALDGLCRFAFLGNLTGLPGGTAPVGMDPGGLPIGLQIVGDAWDEATVLGVLAHLERLEVARAIRPSGAIDLLS